MTYALAALVMALQIADWWTTKRFLAVGVTEANPLMAWTIKRFGITGLLIAKLVFGAVAVALLWTTPFASIALALACAVYVGVIIWNYKRGSN